MRYFHDALILVGALILSVTVIAKRDAQAPARIFWWCVCALIVDVVAVALTSN